VRSHRDRQTYHYSWQSQKIGDNLKIQIDEEYRNQYRREKGVNKKFRCKAVIPKQKQQSAAAYYLNQRIPERYSCFAFPTSSAENEITCDRNIIIKTDFLSAGRAERTSQCEIELAWYAVYQDIKKRTDHQPKTENP